MAGLLQPLSNEYLMDIARYFAALELPYAAPSVAPPMAPALAGATARSREGDGALALALRQRGGSMTRQAESRDPDTLTSTFFKQDTTYRIKPAIQLTFGLLLLTLLSTPGF
jgi:hypothetical protein